MSMCACVSMCEHVCICVCADQGQLTEGGARDSGYWRTKSVCVCMWGGRASPRRVTGEGARAGRAPY